MSSIFKSSSTGDRLIQYKTEHIFKAVLKNGDVLKDLQAVYIDKTVTLANMPDGYIQVTTNWNTDGTNREFFGIAFVKDFVESQITGDGVRAINVLTKGLGAFKDDGNLLGSSGQNALATPTLLEKFRVVEVSSSKEGSNTKKIYNMKWG